jgi:hypothetical protein
MSENRTFHLGDVITVITSRLFSPSGMAGLYNILSYIKGKEVYTRQIEGSCADCREHILNQHPNLAGIDTSGVNPDNTKQWLAEQVEKYGEQIEIKPLV